jgi:hypothetical protein
MRRRPRSQSVPARLLQERTRLASFVTAHACPKRRSAENHGRAAGNYGLIRADRLWADAAADSAVFATSLQGRGPAQRGMGEQRGQDEQGGSPDSDLLAGGA